jgi:hypothetical protein
VRIIYIVLIVFTLIHSAAAFKPGPLGRGVEGLILGSAVAGEVSETVELSEEDTQIIQNLEILEDLEMWENLGLLEDYWAVKEVENLESQAEVNKNEEDNN